MSDKIMTLHPEGKAGVNLDKGKYEFIKNAILDVVKQHEGITFKEMTSAVAKKHKDSFDGSIGWFVTTVKLDLEARGLIEKIDNKSPQRLRYVK